MEFHDLMLRFYYAYEMIKNKKEINSIKRKIFKYLELLEDWILENEDVLNILNIIIHFF